MISLVQFVLSLLRSKIPEEGDSDTVPR